MESLSHSVKLHSSGSGADLRGVHQMVQQQAAPSPVGSRRSFSLRSGSLPVHYLFITKCYNLTPIVLYLKLGKWHEAKLQLIPEISWFRWLIIFLYQVLHFCLFSVGVPLSYATKWLCILLLVNYYLSKNLTAIPSKSNKIINLNIYLLSFRCLFWLFCGSQFTYR